MEYSREAEQAPEMRVKPPPPLTHEDNRRFLEMLREKKERYACNDLMQGSIEQFGLRFPQAGGRRGEGGGAVRGAHRGGRRARGPPHAANAAQLRRQRCPAGSSNSSAAVRQKEMMLYKIHSHAHIQDLQARADELGHSNKSMLVNLVSLESVRIARESYALLRPLINESWIWACPELKILLVVAGLSLEIQKLEHDVLPQLMVQEAKLEEGALEALLLMKNSAITLLDLRKCFQLALGVLLAEEDLVLARVKKLSIMLKDTADDVLKGNCDIVCLQERAQSLVQLATDVLETPVRFCDPDEYSDE